MLKPFLSKEGMAEILGLAIQQQIIFPEDSAVIFYDLGFLGQRIHDLKDIFPPNTLHAIAIKANPLAKVLGFLKTLEVGLEAASLPELYLAQKAGFPSDKIVYDSPAKTIPELEYALKAGVHLNADSFEELERIDAVLQSVSSKSRIGVRINPQVGSGTIKYLSVADNVSKFGIPLDDHREKLQSCFLKYPWLNSIHVHIGSQGCPIPLLVKGIAKVWDFSREIDPMVHSANPSRNIEFFDIGGGLPVSYHHDRLPVSMNEYFRQLQENIPGMFDGRVKIITEFGRYIHANTGFTVSRVEYVKRERNINILMAHVGADLMIRKCYHPADWHHQITLTDPNGNLKSGTDANKYMIAGPLCFSGDIIEQNLALPPAGSGDYIMIHDTGAYTLSMWSRYNSRQIPKVIGFLPDAQSFTVLRERETLDDLWEFWS